MNAFIKNLAGFLFSAAFFAGTLAPSTCHGHAGDVHKQITQSAFNSSSGLANFLSENSVPKLLIAFPPQCSGRRSPMDWLQQGSYYEDEQTYDPFEKLIGESPRCFDHFYTVQPQRTPGLVDGLTDWSEPPIVASLLSGCTVNNSFVWGTQSGIQGPLDVGYNPYKWCDARTNELAALTNATPDARNTSMAMMFYSLGHVLHLNQDTSSPDHVRDAAHMLTAWFEKYATRKDQSGLENYKRNPNWFKLPLNRTVGWANWQAQGFTKLLDFWDRGKFVSGSSEGLKAEARGDSEAKLGLAEFSNGNFLGETALYKECYGSWTIHYFPFPSLMHSTTFADNSTIQGLLASGLRYTTLANGEIVQPIFIDKKDDGITFPKHSVVSYLTAAMVKRGLSPRAAASAIPQVSVSIKNDDVLQTYQSILLPKAVEYSTGILDYFFRGTMDVTVSWGGTNAPNFTNTVLNTSGQDFHGGSFFLLQETNGIRTQLMQTNLIGTLTNRSSLDFLCPGSPTNKLLLVYQGTIGWTNNAASDPVDSNIGIAAARPYFEQIMTYNYQPSLDSLGLPNEATISSNLACADFNFTPTPGNFEVIINQAYMDDNGSIGCDANGVGGISAPSATDCNWPHLPILNEVIPPEDVTIVGNHLQVNITATDNGCGVDIGWVDVSITWRAWP